MNSKKKKNSSTETETGSLNVLRWKTHKTIDAATL